MTVESICGYPVRSVLEPDTGLQRFIRIQEENVDDRSLACVETSRDVRNSILVQIPYSGEA